MQRHELNTPEEMLKRLLYVLYLGCLFFGFLFGLMGLFGGHGGALLTAALLAASAILLKYIGVRHLEFPRLAASFPMGAPEDTLSKEIRTKFVALISAFHDNDSWAERQAIRRKLARLVKQHPPLLDAFGREIAEVHPNLFYDSDASMDE